MHFLLSKCHEIFKKTQFEGCTFSTSCVGFLFITYGESNVTITFNSIFLKDSFFLRAV